MDNVTPFDRPKPAPAPPEDNRAWTPEAMLEAVLADIRAGTIKPQGVMVILTTDGPPHLALVNLSIPERIALMEFAIAATLDEWRTPRR